MKRYFAYASIDENGKAKGGKKGDQTGTELKIRSPYDFGQNQRLRFKSRVKARKAQKIISWVVRSRYCGYNQLERGTLYAIAKKCDWNFTRFKKELKKQKANCDCSSLVATVINLTYGREIAPCFTTAQITTCYKTEKDFGKYFDYYTIPKTEVFAGWIGDIIYKANHHVVMCIKE